MGTANDLEAIFGAVDLSLVLAWATAVGVFAVLVGCSFAGIHHAKRFINKV